MRQTDDVHVCTFLHAQQSGFESGQSCCQSSHFTSAAKYMCLSTVKVYLLFMYWVLGEEIK